MKNIIWSILISVSIFGCAKKNETTVKESEEKIVIENSELSIVFSKSPVAIESVNLIKKENLFVVKKGEYSSLWCKAGEELFDNFQFESINQKQISGSLGSGIELSISGIQTINNIKLSATYKIGMYDSKDYLYVQTAYKNLSEETISLDETGVYNMKFDLSSVQDLSLFTPQAMHKNYYSEDKTGTPAIIDWSLENSMTAGWFEPGVDVMVASHYTLLSKEKDLSVSVGMLTNESFMDEKYVHDDVKGTLKGTSFTMNNNTVKTLSFGEEYVCNPISIDFGKYDWYSGARVWAEMEKELMDVYSKPCEKAKAGPYWSTWYDFNDADWEKTYLEGQMPEYLKLGIGVVEISAIWYNRLSDLTLNKVNFPNDNLREVIDKLHEKGLNNYFWYTQWAVEKGSEYQLNHPDSFFDGVTTVCSDSVYVFNPDIPENFEFQVNILKEMYEKYAVDGFKQDMSDNEYVSFRHEMLCSKSAAQAKKECGENSFYVEDITQNFLSTQYIDMSRTYDMRPAVPAINSMIRIRAYMPYTICNNDYIEYRNEGASVEDYTIWAFWAALNGGQPAVNKDLNWLRDSCSEKYSVLAESFKLFNEYKDFLYNNEYTLLDCFPDGQGSSDSVLWASQQIINDENMGILTVINHKNPQEKIIKVPIGDLKMNDTLYDIINLRTGETEYSKVNKEWLEKGFAKQFEAFDVYCVKICCSV